MQNIQKNIQQHRHNKQLEQLAHIFEEKNKQINLSAIRDLD